MRGVTHVHVRSRGERHGTHALPSRRRRRHFSWFLPVGSDARHQPLQHRVSRVPATIQQLLAGGLEPGPVVAAESAEDVLAVQIPLRFDLVPIKDWGVTISVDSRYQEDDSTT